MRVKKLFLCALLISACVCTTFAKTMILPIETQWKYSVGDNEFATGDFISLPATLAGDEDGFFWLSTTVQVPPALRNQDFFLELGCATASIEIYINGNLTGYHGTIEPMQTCSHVSNTVVPIPSIAATKNTLDIALRCKNNADVCVFEQFAFVNKDRFIKTYIFQPFFNSTIYYMMAAICLFLAAYLSFQFILDKDEKRLMFLALTLIFAAVYFYDIASELIVMPFTLQLGLSRACILFSVGCLTLFLAKFFGHPTKKLALINAIISLIFLVLYCLSANDYLIEELIFKASLLPIFVGIVYLYFILNKAIKEQKHNAKVLLVGISVGLLFAVHDIVYQALGRVPFAWLQGFSFFSIDICVFILICLESVNRKKEVVRYLDNLSHQKETLDGVLKRAAKLSKETILISRALDESVDAVAKGASQSAKKATQIGDFLMRQNKAVQNTSIAVENLVNSVVNIKEEVMTESQVVSTTVDETKLLVKGVNSVSSAIDSAAEFAQKLGEMTKQSCNDVANLVHIMEMVKASSSEILDVAKIVADFSQRTNMLAMNASIEAAHSGVAGKGFSVIAHEIKQFSEASNAQATKINDIVTKIDQTITNGFNVSVNVKNALEDIAQEASSTSHKVNESVASMELQRKSGERINEATALMFDSTTRVKQETDQQYTCSQQVSMDMKQLTQMSTKAESAAEEIISNNDALAKQAQSLAELASRAKATALGLGKLIAN